MPLRKLVLVARREGSHSLRLAEAQKTARDFDEMVKNVPSGVRYAHGTVRIRQASHEYTEARKAALAAQIRLNEFIIYGTVPPELEKREKIPL